jgi:hypothetical protein
MLIATSPWLVYDYANNSWLILKEGSALFICNSVVSNVCGADVSHQKIKLHVYDAAIEGTMKFTLGIDEYGTVSWLDNEGRIRYVYEALQDECRKLFKSFPIDVYLEVVVC